MSSRAPHPKQDEFSKALMQAENLEAAFPEALIPRHFVVGIRVALLEV